MRSYFRNMAGEHNFTCWSCFDCRVLQPVGNGDGWWRCWQVLCSTVSLSQLMTWEMMLDKGTTKAWHIAAICCFSTHFSWCQAFAALAFGICRGVVWHSFNRSICTWHGSGSGSTMFYVSGSVATRLATIWTVEKKTAWLWVACVLHLCATHSSCLLCWLWTS